MKFTGKSGKIRQNGIQSGNQYKYCWYRRTVLASRPEFFSLFFDSPGLTEESKVERNIISNTWVMLGKRKERTTDSPAPNPKNEGDIAAPQSGYTVARQLVLEELDLEIRVRQRLKETIESRIGWATCLKTVVRENQGASVFQR
jgi:hypothetical protein